MQLLLKTLLDAQLADVVGTAVVAFVAAVFDLFFSVWLIRPIAHHVAAARHADSCETAP
jgi:predicted HD phosphohydrolase